MNATSRSTRRSNKMLTEHAAHLRSRLDVSALRARSAVNLTWLALGTLFVGALACSPRPWSNTSSSEDQGASEASDAEDVAEKEDAARDAAAVAEAVARLTSECGGCHAAGYAVEPWAARAVYPDMPLKSLRRNAALPVGQADLLPLRGTLLEWQAWQEVLKEGDPAKGKRCESCHQHERPAQRPPIARLDGLLSAQGASPPSEKVIAMHDRLHISEEVALKETMGLWVDVDTYRTMLAVTVKVLNYGGGHRVPAGAPGENIVLEVEAVNGAGDKLTFVRGERLPALLPSELAGRPGFLYARLFADDQGQPGASPERAVRVHRDTRLQAGEHDELLFYFMLPEAVSEQGEAWTVNARLLWRDELQSGEQGSHLMEVASKTR